MELGTPVKVKQEPLSDSSTSPTVSRYGRSHKPKMQEDFVSTDKKVSAYLKISPGNRIQNFGGQKEMKKKTSPKKVNSYLGSSPRRGRPPKSPNEDATAASVVNLKAMKLEPQDPDTPVDGCDWMVGDLAWARVGGHPFWPCIVALDPIQKIFTKTVVKGRGNVSQRLIHVQFFGDNGRRSWLNITSVMSYNGREAFVQLGETILAGMRKKEPKQTAAFVIKPAVIQVWEKAVQEAEDLANASREDRVAFFALHFPPPQPIITKEVVLEQLGSPLAALLSSPKKRGRKRKTEGTPAEIDYKQKQVKLETEKSLEEEAKKIEEVDPLSTTPRTIADRKKRQALLMQLARNSSVSPGETHSVESSAAGSPATPSFTSTPNISRSEGATTAEIKQTPLKRPANPEPVESVETKKPRKKYEKKKKNYSFKAFSDFKFDRLADEHPELAEDDILKYLKKEWKKLSDLEKERFTSKKGLTEKGSPDDSDDSADDVDMEEASSEEVEEAQSCKSGSPAPPSLTASTQSSQKTPTAKRNHSKSLFSGIKAEKVCLICEKAGDTVRCRGPCQGFYHPICVNSPPSLTPDQPTPTMGKRKKGRPKKSLGNTSLLSSATGVNLSSQSSSGSQLSEDVSQTVTESQAENVESAPPSERTNGKDEIKETDTNGDSVEKEKEIIEKEDIKKNRPVVEVIEPSTKVRKSSKDSKDKDSDSNSNSGSNSGEEGEGFRCKECQEGVSQPCFVCHEYVHKKSGEAKLYRCCTAYCGKLYHEECLKKWPQCSWRTNNGNGKNCERVTVICPQHTCHTCASDNPSVIKARYSNDKLVRCIRCPTTYHYGNYCIPAGSEILTNTQIICPQHYKPAKKITQHVNAAWCFICASGGSLICCDLCPTAFHADCLNISTPPDGSYVCEDCQTGRFPLYGEIVWVKLGTYRWWPAEILYPALIPDNIQNLPHVRGEFCVKFFGSHDHYWVNRGRVFLYQDGDTAGKNYNGRKSSVDNVFVKAAKEASEAQQKYLEDKATRDAETRPGMKPPNYVKLKTNKPVGNVRTVEMNLSSLTPCECDPKKDNPCAPESDCLNRILMVECHPQVCPAGEKCCNQLFEKRLYPSLQPYHTQGRGWGLKTLVPLKKGDFVIEYVGEIINEEEYKKRMIQMHENNEENFYFLTIDKDRMLDAGPKGNVARFMNHSCQPNCETQKWTVSGDTRVGLFALCDIPANTELVFNYNLESIGTDKKPCMCGAPNCSGFIGVKANKNPDREKDDNKEKKSVKRKKSLVPAKTLETECFVCRKPGDLLPCDGKYCTKVYHLACLNKKQRPQGYWLCPWHQCNICNKGRVQRCTLCINSFCQEHSKGNIRIDDARGAVCLTHDQKKNVTVDEKTKSKDSAEGGQCLIKVDSDNIEISSVSQKQPPEKSGKISKVDAANVENSVSIKKVDVVSIENPVTVKKVELINNNIIKTENVNSPSRRTRRSQSSAETGIHCSVERVSKRRSRPSSVDEKLIGAFKKTESNNSKKVNLSCKTLDQKYFAELLDEVVDNLPLRDAVVEDPSVHSENSKEECTSKEFDHEEPSAIEENAYKRSEVQKINGKIKEEQDGNSLDKDNSIEFSASAKSLVSSCDCDAIGQDLDHKTGQRSINSLNCCSQEEISQTESVELNFKLEDSLNQESSETESNVEATEQESKPVESSEEKDETSSQKIVKNVMSENDKTEESERISAPNTEKKSETSEETAKKFYVVADLKDDEIKENGPNISTKDLENDFELSYSDCSNDKIFQNVINSESSIELKVTNCTNTKTVQKTEDLGKVESKSDLHNGLENHNPMEVA